MAAYRVGQNSGPIIFRRLWTKVHRIKFACAGLTIVRSLRSHFPIDDVLLRSEDNRDQVAKLWEIVPKSEVFGPRNFGRKGPPYFLPNVLGRHRTYSKVW